MSNQEEWQSLYYLEFLQNLIDQQLLWMYHIPCTEVLGVIFYLFKGITKDCTNRLLPFIS